MIHRPCLYRFAGEHTLARCLVNYCECRHLIRGVTQNHCAFRCVWLIADVISEDLNALAPTRLDNEQAAEQGKRTQEIFHADIGELHTKRQCPGQPLFGVVLSGGNQWQPAKRPITCPLPQISPFRSSPAVQIPLRNIRISCGPPIAAFCNSDRLPVPAIPARRGTPAVQGD